MTAIKSLLTKALFLLTLISTASGFAADMPGKDALTPVDFTNQALISNLAQLETAKLALQQSRSPEVREFAQLVIDERTTANNDLSAIADKKRLRVISGNELRNRAQAFIINGSNTENFDAAYVQNQIKARQDEIELFNKGALSKDPEVAGFATENIPKLTHNLHLAETLATDIIKIQKP